LNTTEEEPRTQEDLDYQCPHKEQDKELMVLETSKAQDILHYSYRDVPNVCHLYIVIENSFYSI
jgi:hypothetical protein